MIVLLFVCVIVLGLVADSVSVSMKIRVNERLPEDRKLSWWWRDYREVNRIYHEYCPDSILPDVASNLGYVVIALMVVLVLTSFFTGSVR